MISTVWIDRDVIPNLIEELQEYYERKDPREVLLSTETHRMGYKVLKLNGKEIKV
jgi:hypothetical protein